MNLIHRHLFIFSLFFLFHLAAVYSDLVDPGSNIIPVAKYLKPIEISQFESGLSGVDCIYVINLDQRKERWKRTRKLLKTHKLQANRVSAINGYYISQQTRKQLKGPYPAQIRAGEIGCLLSHISVIKDAYERGFDCIWVLEDDVEFVEDIQQLSPLLIQLSQIDPEWDVLYTDVDSQKNGQPILSLSTNFRPDREYQPLDYYLKKTLVSNDIMNIRQRFGMYSVLISRRGIKKILTYFLNNYLWSAIDIDIHYIPGIREYAMTRDIVCHRVGDPFSDSQDGIPPRIVSISKQIITACEEAWNRLTAQLHWKNIINYLVRHINIPSQFHGMMPAFFAYQNWEQLKHKTIVESSSLPGWFLQEKGLLLMDLVKEHQFQECIEVGVFAGASLLPIMKALQYTESGRVHAIDAWDVGEAVKGFNVSDPNYLFWTKLDLSIFQKCCYDLIDQHNLHDYCNIIQLPSQKAVHLFADNSIDFIHFNGNHSEEGIFQDVTSYFPKVKDGGYFLLNDSNWGNAGKAVVFLLERADLMSAFTPLATYLFFKKNAQREKNASCLFNP